MSETIEISEADACEIIGEGQSVKTQDWKWGTRESYVFERGGKHYMVEVEMHSQDGAQTYDPMVAERVYPHIVKKTVWRKHPCPQEDE
jgi:hypothetical protein